MFFFTKQNLIKINTNNLKYNNWIILTHLYFSNKKNKILYLNTNTL